MYMNKYIKTIAFAALVVANAISLSAQEILPVTGSWVNLFYQDVRNKYTNPQHMDNTDPDFWQAKVREMHEQGIEYLIFMATANEGKADYPSKIMPWAYDTNRKSPVCAIMDEADQLGMKVFMSIGWAKDQDDNLKIPEILQRQKDIMNELAQIYGNRSSFYGWYLPVEDCLGPVLTDAAVKAVNSLVEKAHKLTPGKKTMISPYGFFCSEFDNPKFGEQIEKLKVDIIAYQDEVGCVREDFPMPRLKESWKKMRAIHDRTNIEMWANCELFTWEKGLNSRQSALIPAAMPRVISQLAAASQGGAERIISFMVYGIWDTNSTPYSIAQPHLSKVAADDYSSWRANDSRWHLLNATLMGKAVNGYINNDNPLFDGKIGDESPLNENWTKFSDGYNSIDIPNATDSIKDISVRFLNCPKKGITFPYKVYLYSSSDGNNYTLKATKDVPDFANAQHDTWVDCITFKCSGDKFYRIAFESDKKVAIDEIFINLQINK